MSERTVEVRDERTVSHTSPLMQTDIVRSSFARGALAFLRIVVGWIFIWAFVDKLFGLGYSTPGERAWINGGSPTFGFLSNASGAFGDMFQAMAGAAPFFDWLFMAGLLGIGVALVTGAGVKLAAITGTLLVFMMYLATFPLGQEGATNPLTTTHWIEAAAMITVAATRAGDTFGLGKWWSTIVGDSILR
ncbi:DoxX family protein [Ornithinimicrobium sp. Y1847]|uniref:DoxX family protein n=1 Tax=Ornithinimicrobium sp. Y1847 TaxID=3405419 RepID=UPI003B6797BC